MYNVQCVGASQVDALHLAQGAWLGLLGVDVVLHKVLEARLPTRRTRRQLLVLCIIHCVCRLEINELFIALWMFSRASQMEFTSFQVPHESSKVIIKGHRDLCPKQANITNHAYPSFSG